jgi:hypothetical protein
MYKLLCATNIETTENFGSFWGFKTDTDLGTLVKYAVAFERKNQNGDDFFILDIDNHIVAIVRGFTMEECIVVTVWDSDKIDGETRKYSYS